MIRMQQVHGNKVVVVDKKDDGKIVSGCDAIVTNIPKVKLSVRVADCLPIFVSAGNSVGLIHAGWRGLSRGIIKETTDLMKQKFDLNPENTAIFIGPHICQKHYEVKSDVSDNFEGYAEVLLKKNDKIFLDLAQVAKLQFEALGISNIKIDKTCTFEDRDLFSYRRDKTELRNVYVFGLDI